MRRKYSTQTRLDCETVLQVQLNLNCRDEIVPILRALQHVYSQASIRDSILQLIGEDVNEETRTDCGRRGFDYWQILVLAAVRLGCNLNYDKLQDLAEQHRALRQIMGIGDWEEKASCNWRTISENVRHLQPETIKQISNVIVGAGHESAPEAVKKVRADSFVVETDVHYPTESSLIVDGVRKVLELCAVLSVTAGVAGWRQHKRLLKKVKQIARNISRISASKDPSRTQKNEKQYRTLIARAETILGRATELCETLEHESGLSFDDICQLAALKNYVAMTEQVCGTARRRVLEGESVPNEDKLFSLFEPHTQLYKRGKAGQPVQFGRLVLVYEDAAGFITDHDVLARDAQDKDVIIPRTAALQKRLEGRIEEASFDRGFHSPENQEKLAEIIANPCLPMPGSKQSVEQTASATVRFHKARQRHPGIESAIGALQTGNGLERCRDSTEKGFQRYVALAVLGRNLHVLGKLLIAQEDPLALAAFSKRGAA